MAPALLASAPVHVVVDTTHTLPHWTNWVPVAGPIVTVIVASVATLIAWRSLKASRESVEAAAKNVRNSEDALRGTVRPILDVGIDHHALHIEISNVGPGVALDVHALISGVVVGGMGWPMYTGWFEEAPNIPMIAPGATRAMSLRGWRSETKRSPLMVLLTCRDVNGTVHWIHRTVGHTPLSAQPTLGVGRNYPEPVRRFLDEYAEAKEQRAAQQEARRARIKASVAG